MDLALVSLGALVCAVLVSCTTAINVGILSLSLAWFVGVYLGGMPVDALLQGFPTALFLTLIGVTLLFSMAETNGTLERVTSRAVRLCRGNAFVLPIMFFALGLLIATIGPGGTPTSALLAQPAMAVSARAGIPPLLMAVMAGNGALAGTLSPFAPTGVVAHSVMGRIGLGGVEWQTYAYNMLAHTIVGFGGYLVLGGWRLLGRPAVQAAPADAGSRFDRRNWLTLGAIVALLVAVAGFGAHVGFTAMAAAALLTLARAADEKAAIGRMPWSVILMVTGVTVLISIVEKAEGLDLFTSALAGAATRESIAPLAAFGAGVVSVYSSTSGVVLPAFLPTVPGLAERIGNGLEPLPLAWAMNVGASLVDLSSLSTVGALFLAAAPSGTDTRRLFNALLAWGLSMTLVAPVLCWLLFG
jgi:di/tricarboxylate transporter